MDNYIKSNGEERISWQFMEYNNFFCTFFVEKFGGFKKKQYLCTRF